MNTMSHMFWIVAFVMSMNACGDNSMVSNPPGMEMEVENPDTMMQSDSDQILYFNGQIYTVDEAIPWAEAMIISDGLIVYVGTTAEAQSMAEEGAEMIDLNNALVLPGFHDVHLHPLEVGSKSFKFILDEKVEDPEDYAIDVEAALDANPGDGWILGWGYDLEVLFSAKRLPKEILDDVAPDRPLGIMEVTSHSIWCNSKALEVMGISDDTYNPTGGVIMREEDGEANGILIDNAGNLLIDMALPVTAESLKNDYDGLINVALPELAQNGITSICDARTYWKRDHHKTWQKVFDEDNLTTRVNLGLWVYPTEDDATQLATIKSLYDYDANSLLNINQIKLYSDGIIHNTTSAMHDDYKLDYFGGMTNNGVSYINEDRLAMYIAELEPIGFDFHIHAIGNRGIHESLNAIEQSGTSAGRHRLTHVEYVDPSDYSRFAELNVTADAQVAGDFTNPDHWHDFDFLIDRTVSDNAVPIKSLQENGARITLSSDWDVSALNPFIGLQNAVTRAPQNISIEDALKAYTINAAYVMRQEDIVGSLVAGKEADFIILDRNIFEIDPMTINQTKVIKTYLHGEVVFE